MSSFWHPFSNPVKADRERFMVVRGRGSTVVAADGSEYFDATAALWYCAVGHGREPIAAAIGRQAGELAAYSCFDVYATESTLEVADRIAAAVPMETPRVFLTSGGSDGVETAAKIARRHFVLRGQPERSVIIAREDSYHGTHTFGTSLGGIAGNRDGWGPLVDEVARVPRFDVGALEETIRSLGPERVAAFFVEPMVGAGGVFPPPEEYLSQVEAVCRANGVLMVCDEVISGVGRTGSWTASERFGVQPDMIILAKALTSGYQPLGAVAVNGFAAAPFFEGEGSVLRHGYTYSGHATACAAAIANLDLIQSEDLIGRVETLGEKLPGMLGPLADLDGVEEVRCLGLTAGIQLDAARLEEAGATPADIVLASRQRGQLTRVLASGSLQFSPPYIATESEITRFADAVADALSDVLTAVKPLV